jgi:GntR family transcriptional regulator/MocR family aminotransferase
VRLGYLILPPDLVEPFVTARVLALGHGSLIEQSVLADFIAEGHFARHLRRMRTLYVERQSTLKEAAERYLPGQLDVQPTATGIHLVAWLPPEIDDRLVAQRAGSVGIIARPVSAFRVGTSGRPGLVLGFASVRPAEIWEAIRRLAEVFPPVPASRST